LRERRRPTFLWHLLNFEAEEQETVPGVIQHIIEHGIIEHCIIQPHDIEIARNLVEIDDDNEPTPENTPLVGEGEQANVS
jgi:DNA-directed RNA polymerase subunit E'/Rpb7